MISLPVGRTRLQFVMVIRTACFDWRCLIATMPIMAKIVRLFKSYKKVERLYRSW